MLRPPIEGRSALDELFRLVGTYRKGQDFFEMLDFIREFHDLAPYNAFLVHVQKPGSHFVASAEDWLRKYGRTVKIGARPLVILWPFAPVHFVFELNDTEGEGLPTRVERPFMIRGDIPPWTIRSLLGRLPRFGVSVHYADQGSARAGSIQVLEKATLLELDTKIVRLPYAIVLNKNLKPGEHFATVIHELGHLFCGHLGSPDGKCWPDRMNLRKNAQEFEAESVSWIVCSRAGLSTPSAEYLAGYLDRDGNVPQDISPETIFKAAGMIEGMLERTPPFLKPLIVKQFEKK